MSVMSILPPRSAQRRGRWAGLLAGFGAFVLGVRAVLAWREGREPGHCEVPPTEPYAKPVLVPALPREVIDLTDGARGAHVNLAAPGSQDPLQRLREARSLSGSAGTDSVRQLRGGKHRATLG